MNALTLLMDEEELKKILDAAYTYGTVDERMRLQNKLEGLS